MKQVPLDQLSFTAFKELVRTRFHVEVAPATMVELELIKAEFTGEGTKDKSSAPRHESFSLIFSGAMEERLTQKTYRFQHEKIGVFELFIVPIAAEGVTIHYQAIFNRLIPPTAAP